MPIQDGHDSRYPSSVVADGREFRSPDHLARYRAGTISLRDAVTPFGMRPPLHRSNRVDQQRFRTRTQRRFG